MEKKTIITQKDCQACRFTLMCSGSALFETIAGLQNLTFDEKSCPRDWQSLKDLVEPEPPAPSPTL